MAGARSKRQQNRASTASSTRSRPVVSSTSRGALCAALIVVAGIVAYANSLSVPFHYDDTIGVVENTQIRRLWPITEALSPPSEGQPVSGRPLANLSLAVNYAIGELDLTGYHVVNIGLHIVCALLLFAVVRQTLALDRFRDRFDGDAADGFALTAALLWVLHPLQSQVVTYISARHESIVGAFYLLTLYCSIRAGRAILVSDAGG